MTTVLKMKFRDNKGGFQYMSIAHPKPNLDAKKVRQAMELVSASNMFVKDDLQMYVTPVAAYYISTTKEPLFADDVKSTKKAEPEKVAE